jgi:hypothetical protein
MVHSFYFSRLHMRPHPPFVAPPHQRFSSGVCRRHPLEGTLQQGSTGAPSEHLCGLGWRGSSQGQRGPLPMADSQGCAPRRWCRRSSLTLLSIWRETELTGIATATRDARASCPGWREKPVLVCGSGRGVLGGGRPAEGVLPQRVSVASLWCACVRKKAI